MNPELVVFEIKNLLGIIEHFRYQYAFTKETQKLSRKPDEYEQLFTAIEEQVTYLKNQIKEIRNGNYTENEFLARALQIIETTGS